MEKFWTITQKSEIQKICREHGIPQNVEDEIFKVIHILDSNYGIGRDIGADGGYVALFLETTAVDSGEYQAILEQFHLEECNLEFSDILTKSGEWEWHSDLYIATNDYGITIIYPNRDY